MDKEHKQREKGAKGIMPLTFILLCVSAGCIVFATLCLYASINAFFMKNAFLLSISSGILIIALFVFCVWLYYRGKERAFKAIFILYVLLFFCLVLCFALQKTGFFNVIKDPASLQAYLENAGAWMPVFYVLLQYLQVVVLPIPSIVSTVAGVALFGPLGTTIYSLIGILLGSLTAFFIGRKLGNKAVSWMVGEETLEKWQKKLKGKDNLVLTLMFLLPVFPDDILCFIAGLSSMRFGYFTVMIVVSRVLAITATCYSINFIPFNTWWGITIWCALIASIVVAFIYIHRNFDKIQNVLSKRFKIFRKKK